MISATPIVSTAVTPEQNMKTTITPAQAQQNFSTMLKSAINRVNDAQIASNNAIESLVNGENVDLHTVMITAEKASITLQTSLEIRNKAVEAYQEIMRMQV
ncbi:flagellar hook-basal body complex protein FliE [Bacillus sp. SM2101]|uniref:flagellar hook-basal body complex protein FliE n=1 Tax=Cytobacillus sp. IB215316 TaxID=3097354 RepID=UPI001BDE558F